MRGIPDFSDDEESIPTPEPPIQPPASCIYNIKYPDATQYIPIKRDIETRTSDGNLAPVSGIRCVKNTTENVLQKGKTAYDTRRRTLDEMASSTGTSPRK